jgi:hypothetical protein
LIPLKELEINNEELDNEMFKKPEIGLSKTITHFDIKPEIGLSETITHFDIVRTQENTFIIDVENLGIISPEDTCVGVRDKVVEGSKNSQN